MKFVDTNRMTDKKTDLKQYNPNLSIWRHKSNWSRNNKLQQIMSNARLSHDLGINTGQGRQPINKYKCPNSDSLQDPYAEAKQHSSLKTTTTKKPLNNIKPFPY